MSEIIQEQFNQAIQQTIQQDLSPGYKTESVFTSEDLSYTVVACFVDLQNVVPGAKHSYSKSDSLIKYSEAEYSPVSSKPSNLIKLSTPLYYNQLKKRNDSELRGDDLEGAAIERLDWNRRGSRAMESVKKNLERIPNSRGNVKVKLTLGRHDFCMYCTSIDPYLSSEREKQMKGLSVDYDFMTKIEEPSEFAKQLGCDVGEHISLHNNLQCDYSQPLIMHTLGSFYRNQTGFMGEYLISVNHGPVIYLSGKEIEEIVKEDSELKPASVLPFVKRKKYKEQQEYRFIISIQGHILDKKEFYLKVSADLRNLMSEI